MPKFQIFHKIDTDFRSEMMEPFEKNYLHVADVECERLSDTFGLTNHIDTDWALNEGVVAFSRENRSTSVGDVVRSEDGVFHVCASIGWEEVTI